MAECTEPALRYRLKVRLSWTLGPKVTFQDYTKLGCDGQATVFLNCSVIG